MNDECIVCVFDSLEQAEQAVRTLQRADFPTQQISLVASSAQETARLKDEFQMGDDSVRDAAIGSGLGGILGLLLGVGLAAVPAAGVVVFFVGPIAGAATGTVVGGLVGAMFGWGVHKDHVQHYEQCIKDRKVLMIANGNPLELVQAERILKETDVAEVHLHSKTSSDAPEVLGRRSSTVQLRTEFNGSAASGQIKFRNQATKEGRKMALDEGRERIKRAVGILVDEKDRIKDRLLIAYASQLSLIEPREDLPPELLDAFFLIRNALSDAEMPYGSGQRAAEKLNAMSEDQASSLARDIYSMFLKLHERESEPAASTAAADD